MRKAQIVDANSIGWAAHHGTVLSVGDLQTQAILGFIRSMRELHVLYPEHEKVVLWDGKAKWRFEALPTYKTGREDTAEQKAVRNHYAEQKPLIQEALKHLGIRQLTAWDREADDLAGTLVGGLSKQGYQISLITGDRDWLQFVRPNAEWRDMRESTRHITFDNFEEKTGYKTPLAFLEGKCLQGDTSDAIPGVGRIGEKRALEVLNEFGSVRKFWQAVDSGAYVPKYKHLIALASPEGRRRFGANLKLMQLIKQPPIDKSQFQDIKPAPDIAAFRELCEDLMFKRICNDFDNFIFPFNISHR